MMNLGEKLGILVNLERRLQDKSMKSKIVRFGSIFMEKSMSEIKVEKVIAKRENLIKFLKINLI